ncbi:MAG: cell division protein ZapB [Desulfuromonadales bacterium]|nr:cell division protein ZapB [Desulfuromonadales bacterium]
MLDRLEQAVDRLLEKNRALAETCQRLESEKAEWYGERTELLASLDDVLERLDSHLAREDS